MRWHAEDLFQKYVKVKIVKLHLSPGWVTRECQKAFLMCPAAQPSSPLWVCHFVRPHKDATRSCAEERGRSIGCVMDIPEASTSGCLFDRELLRVCVRRQMWSVACQASVTGDEFVEVRPCTSSFMIVPDVATSMANLEPDINTLTELWLQYALTKRLLSSHTNSLFFPIKILLLTVFLYYFLFPNCYFAPHSNLTMQNSLCSFLIYLEKIPGLSREGSPHSATSNKVSKINEYVLKW